MHRESVPQQEIQIVEKTRRGRGRPKANPIEVIWEADEPGVIALERPTKVKQTAKRLKEMELEVQLLELQAVSGNSNLRVNKKGKVDGRQLKQRTQKQIDATARLVEANKLKRIKKKQQEKDELMLEQKVVVGNIISSLNTANVIEKETSEKQGKIDEDEKLKKANERQKVLPLFD